MVSPLSRCLAGALLTVAVLAFPVSPASAAKRIVGGSFAAPNEFPYAAGLQLALVGEGGDEPDALCGGALVAARWVVTAAHCLAEPPGADLAHSVAILGTTDLTTATPDQRFALADAFVAPAFLDGNGNADVGLIQLARPAPQAQLRLLRAEEAALYAPNTPAATIGWGLTEDQADGGTLSGNALRKVDLRIYSDQECQRSFAAAGQPSGLDFSTEICALNPGKDSCNGDSGSPLLVADGGGAALAGAVSFGIGSGNILRPGRSCNEGPPGVYARLGPDPLNAFIRSKVPQVEIDRDVAAPVPGQRVTFTAAPRNPDRTGPFGGYDALSWDLDGDGAFGEAANQRSVSKTVPAGISAVSVLATSTAGDAETRTVRVATQNKAAVSFSATSVAVREGSAAALAVRRVGAGGGTAIATPSGSAAHSGARSLSFSGKEASQPVTFATRGDRTPGRGTTFQVVLGGLTGDLIAGVTTAVTVTVVDDDLSVRSARETGRRLRLRVRSGPGRLKVRGAASAASRRVSGLGTRTLTARVVRPGGRVTVTFIPKGLESTVSRAVRLK